MLESLLQAAKAIGPIFLFMLLPIFIPMIAIGLSTLNDLLRKKKEPTWSEAREERRRTT